MGEKDVTEKYLMAFNDVFVDIYNVLLFEADVLKEEYLRRNRVGLQRGGKVTRSAKGCGEGVWGRL